MILRKPMLSDDVQACANDMPPPHLLRRVFDGLCRCAMVLLIAATQPVAAQNEGTTKLPPPERARLTVASDDNYPPYIFRDASGNLNGYLVELWALWSQETGVAVDLLASDWGAAQARMSARRADVIDTIFQTPEREAIYDFTAAYAQIPVSIFSDKKIGGITKLSDLVGFLVGVKAGDACIETLQAAGVDSLQTYRSYESLVQASIDGSVRLFCLDEPPANYLLYKHEAQARFYQAFELQRGELSRAVHKGDSQTLALVQRGFSAINLADEQALRDKWMGKSLRVPAYVSYLAYGLSAAALSAILSILWGYTLRRQVRARTAELEEERLRLRTLLEAIPDMVWMKDPEGVFHFCNPTVERLFGVKEAEIVGKRADDFVDAAQAEIFQADDRKTIESGTVCIHEEWLTFAGAAEAVLVETRKTPVFDARGQVLGVLGLARDITARKRVELALQESEDRLRTILDSVEACIYIKDCNYRYQYANRRLCELYGRPLTEMIGCDDSVFFDAPTAENLRMNDRRVIENGERVAEEEVSTGIDHQIASAFYSVKLPLRDQDGQIYGLCGISTDITDQKSTDASLRIAAVAFESQQGMLITDAQTIILRVNQSLVDMTGYAAQELVGKTPKVFASGRHDADYFKVMWDSINRTGSWQGEIWDRRKNGEIYPKWLSITAVKGIDGDVTHYVGTQNDITDRKAAEAQIRNLAFYDPLTSLPNRRLLADRLQHALVSSARSGKEGALLFIDLDHFKTLNDTLGHDKGDLLLQRVAQRIHASIRDGDTVARLGGDEFVVMLEGLNQDNKEAAKQTQVIADKILRAICQPYDLNGQKYRSSSSIGITLFDAQNNSSEELMKRADMAMYKAKAAGRNALRFFDPSMQSEVSERARVENDLREALRQQHFILYYQPQLDGSGRITGAESLVRWQHPEQGVVPPGHFIPLAEETGLILPLGAWVLESACQQLARWGLDPARKALRLAVNVSAAQLHQADFVEHVVALLEQAGANPHRLKLELTESRLLDDIEDSIDKMRRLSALGVGFSLDDFGTGYSSLAYLKRLPLEELKIDRSFVRDILTDPNDAAIARTVVALADSLGLSVIAEGVETEAQRVLLAENGCRDYQGFLFSPPLPIDQFDALITTGKVR